MRRIVTVPSPASRSLNAAIADVQPPSRQSCGAWALLPCADLDNVDVATARGPHKRQFGTSKQPKGSSKSLNTRRMNCGNVNCGLSRSTSGYSSRGKFVSNCPAQALGVPRGWFGC